MLISVIRGYFQEQELEHTFAKATTDAKALVVEGGVQGQEQWQFAANTWLILFPATSHQPPATLERRMTKDASDRIKQ